MDSEPLKVARYLVRKPSSPLSLGLSAQAELIRDLSKVNRLHSTAVRQWCQKNIPQLVRESLLRRAGKELLSDCHKFLKLWSVLYSHQMHVICIPTNLDDKARETVLSYLGSGFTSEHNSVPTIGECAVGNCI